MFILKGKRKRINLSKNNLSKKKLEKESFKKFNYVENWLINLNDLISFFIEDNVVKIYKCWYDWLKCLCL